jgi:hypothetical protein
MEWRISWFCLHIFGFKQGQTIHPLFISPPKVLEPIGCHFGVDGGIGNIPMAEPMLQGTGSARWLQLSHYRIF